MNKTELLAALEDAQAQLDDILADIDPAALETPGAAGEWSVKDVLSHLTAWAVDLLTELGLAERGQKPAHPAWTGDAILAQNDLWYKQYKNRPLERVVADYDGVHRQLLRKVTSLNDKQLAGPVPWQKEKPLAQYIFDEIIKHERGHALKLRPWAEAHPNASVTDGG